MLKTQRNFAFIDSQNLNLSIQHQGWKLDFCRFRVYLAEKYRVERAYLFIGYMREHHDLYRSLQEKGFVIIFKPTLKYGEDGLVKGNCDAELVLQAMIDYGDYDKAVIVTGDGDFYCLIKYLLGKAKLGSILIPNRMKFSALLKFGIFQPYLRYLNDLRERLAYKKERPHKDRTS